MITKFSHQFSFSIRLLYTLLTLGFLVSGTLAQTKPAGAKALFYDPATGTVLSPAEKQKRTAAGRIQVKNAPPAQVKYPGINYWIELEGQGSVTDEHIFQTGDRIRLHVRSNVDGYVSFWSLDSSGRGKPLYPTTTDVGSQNFVKADSEFSPTGYIRFAPPVEDERLLIFFSRNKDELPKPQGETINQDLIAKAAAPKGSKALVFETEKNAKAEVGTYVINREGGPIVKEIRLKHQAPRTAQ